MPHPSDTKSDKRHLGLKESVSRPFQKPFRPPPLSNPRPNQPSRIPTPKVSHGINLRRSVLGQSEESVAMPDKFLRDNGDPRLSLPTTQAGRFAFIAALGLCTFCVALIAGRSSSEALLLGIALAAMMTALFD